MPVWQNYNSPCFKRDSIFFFQNSLQLIQQKYKIPPFQRHFSFSKFPYLFWKKYNIYLFPKAFSYSKLIYPFCLFLHLPIGDKKSCWIKVFKQISATRVWIPKIRVVTWWRPAPVVVVVPINQMQSLVFNLQLVWSEYLYPAFRLHNQNVRKSDMWQIVK